MKILFLNPFIDSTHEIATRLKSLGAAVLYPANVDEAWKMVQLHGTSLDLAIVHREFNLPSGIVNAEDVSAEFNLTLLTQFKASAEQADLPVLVTSSAWGDIEFYKHQEGKSGANAYLKWPVEADILIQTIETMFGDEALWGAVAEESEMSEAPAVKVTEVSESPAASIAPPTPPPPPTRSVDSITVTEIPDQNVAFSNIVLEEASRPDIPMPSRGEGAGSSTGISLVFDAPDAGVVSFLDSGNSADSAPLPAFEAALEPAAESLEPHERLMLAANTQEENLLSPAPETFEAPESSEAQKTNETRLLQLGLEQNEIREAAFQADDLEANLPYLFNNRKAGSSPSGQPGHQLGHGGLSPQSIVNQVMMFAEPVGDAVVPGGAAQSPDTETLKKYLLLREQDVAVLSNQLKSAREQVLSFDKKLKEANGQILELKHVVNEQQRRIEEGDQGAERLVEGLQKENEELHFQAKVKTDKVKVMEAQVKAASDEVEHLKERVRTDIRKIRVREKELANKLEIMRRDSEALIASRESKIIELKRKVDLLEFNLDLLQDQYSREKENSAQLRERLGKAAQVVRVAGGLLDPSAEGTGGRDRTSASGKGEIQSASKVRETA